ncbi:MAG TPA: hypothetical protein ENK23_06220 [Sorangium sp.]|nr:hypothetical protein [Sorangium sp.]
MTLFARRTLAIFSMFCATSAMACGSPEADLCDLKIQCEGGDTNVDLANEICLLQADADAETANLQGCGDLYDQAIECYNKEENHFCDKQKFKTGGGCDALFGRLDKCIGDPKTIDLKD